MDGSISHPLSRFLKDGLEDRKLTIILYLNENKWDSSAGGLTNSGNLRCFFDTNLDDMTGSSASEVRIAIRSYVIFINRILSYRILAFFTQY